MKFAKVIATLALYYQREIKNSLERMQQHATLHVERLTRLQTHRAEDAPLLLLFDITKTPVTSSARGNALNECIKLLCVQKSGRPDRSPLSLFCFYTNHKNGLYHEIGLNCFGNYSKRISRCLGKLETLNYNLCRLKMVLQK